MATGGDAQKVNEIPDHRFSDVIAAAQSLATMRTAVVNPVDGPSILGAFAAYEADLIEPVLIGPSHRIRSAAASAGVDVGRFEVIDVQSSVEAAEVAVATAADGAVRSIMKGAIHTDELLRPIMARRSGLRTSRRMSHVFVLEVPAWDRHLLITDAVINVAPDLDAKRDIVQNAIDLALTLGVVQPKVAVLAAVETVTPELPATIDGAGLAMMNQRGQITGGVVDGPLALDLAVSAGAAATKGVVGSSVAGHADVLVVPDLNAGNILAKALEHVCGGIAAGVVLGAQVPIALTSRSDGAHARLASSALAVLLASARMKESLS